MGHYGIDISSNQPHPIGWRAAFADLAGRGSGGQPFVIVKATEGTGYVNPLFVADVANARAAGFAIAAYLFDRGSANVAAEQALFNRVAVGLPQWDDDEAPDGLSSAQYVAHCQQLLDQNPIAGVYMNQDEENRGFHEGVGLWEANYNNQPGVTKHPALIHQYTSSGRVAGVGGLVDLNVWLGSEAEFAAWFRLTPVVPIPFPPVPAPAPSPKADDMLIVAFTGQATLLIAGGRAVPLIDQANVTLLFAALPDVPVVHLASLAQYQKFAALAP